MADLIQAHLDAAFGLYLELAPSLDAEQLSQTLPVPSNSIGAQLWCVIGARETMTRAIETGTWGPFSCSVTASEIVVPATMLTKLEESASAFRQAASSSPDGDVRTGFQLDLLEHENTHLGQLLRYLLGLGLEIPPGWRQRFAL